MKEKLNFSALPGCHVPPVPRHRRAAVINDILPAILRAAAAYGGLHIGIPDLSVTAMPRHAPWTGDLRRVPAGCAE